MIWSKPSWSAVRATDVRPRILVSGLPRKPWWSCGLPAYPKNWAMRAGCVPDAALAKAEHRRFLCELRAWAELVVVPFPERLDRDGNPRHDFVFVRDSFICNRRGEVLLCRFAAAERQEEVAIIGAHLAHLGYRVHALPEGAIAEGGEFHFVSRERILFSGICRNNMQGISRTAEVLGAGRLCIVETDAFHLDTVLSPVLDSRGRLRAVLACLQMIHNAREVVAFLERQRISLIEVDHQDSIGPPGHPGSLAVNCLALPGLLVGGAAFKTDGVDRRLADLGIRHAVCPVTQFGMSGGGVHCLSNEL
jgi:N-dimethylarginine dimethylaminohydrolase